MAGNPGHAASQRLFTACTAEDSACGAHSLAELYSTLTRLPAPNRVAPMHALQCVKAIRERVGLITLDGPAYVAAIEGAASNQIAGGTIYDALLVACAIQCGAERIYTWNIRHFRLFGAAVVDRLATPPE